MRRIQSCIAVAIVAGFAASVRADDVFPPSWRGQFGTVTAAWDFWGQEGFGPRSINAGFYSANPGGLPDPLARAYIDSNVYVHNSLFGRQSVLEIGPNGAPGDIGFGMQNYPGYDSLIVHIQITYYPGGGAPLQFGIGPDSDTPPWQWQEYVPAVVGDTFMHDEGWRTATYGFTVDPSTTFHGFGIIFTDYPAYVDQVVVDTRAVPAPSALALLALGAGAAARRRRGTCTD